MSGFYYYCLHCQKLHTRHIMKIVLCNLCICNSNRIRKFWFSKIYIFRLWLSRYRILWRVLDIFFLVEILIWFKYNSLSRYKESLHQILDFVLIFSTRQNIVNISMKIWFSSLDCRCKLQVSHTTLLTGYSRNIFWNSLKYFTLLGLVWY